MIAIVDYGLGNVQAFLNVYKRLNVPALRAVRPEDLAGANKIILPGVGAFDYAMTRLEQSGIRPELDRLVKEHGVPVIGICVGMQMMAESSEEGRLPGLGWIPGKVRRFNVARLKLKTHLPHMGWNDVTPTLGEPLFEGLESDARFYFLHSYYFECTAYDDVIAFAEYGDRFCCAVRSKNVYGVQFHPEKSHAFGMRLLKNYAEL